MTKVIRCKKHAKLLSWNHCEKVCNGLWDERLNDFLQDRPQHVVVNGFKSKNMILNTSLCPPGLCFMDM